MGRTLRRSLRRFHRIGSDDRLIDLFVLAGPLVVGLVALLGRTGVTELLAVAYVGGFVGYVVYKAVARRRGTGPRGR